MQLSERETQSPFCARCSFVFVLSVCSHPPPVLPYCNLTASSPTVWNGDAGTCVGTLASGSTCNLRCAAGFVLLSAPMRCEAGVLRGGQYCAAINSALVGGPAEVTLLFEQSSQTVRSPTSFAAVPRLQPGMAYTGQTLFLFGGGDLIGNDYNTVFSSADGTNWNVLPNANWSPRRIEHASMVSVGSAALSGSGSAFDRVWVFGGKTQFGLLSNDVWYSDDGLQSWTQVLASGDVLSFPAATGFAAVWIPAAAGGAATYGSFLLCGGQDAAVMLDCYWLDGDLATLGWSVTTSWPVADEGLYGASMVLTQNEVGTYSILLLGGFSADGVPSNAVWKADPNLQGNVWTIVTPNAPWSRRGFSQAFAIGASVFVGFAGFASSTSGSGGGGGTGEAPLDLSSDVWASHDFGSTWSLVTASLPWPQVDADGATAVTVLPTNTGAVWVYSASAGASSASSTGLWRVPYTTGGWSAVYSGSNGVSSSIVGAGTARLANGSYVLVCGYWPATQSFSSTVWSTNDGRSFTALPGNPGGARAFFSLGYSPATNRMVVFGGLSGAATFSASVFFTDDAGSAMPGWQQRTSPSGPAARQEGASVWISQAQGASSLHGDLIIISGGCLQSTGASCQFQDVWRLSLEDFTWTLVTDGVSAPASTGFWRLGASAVAVDVPGSNTPMILLAGGVGPAAADTEVRRSLDLGANWSLLPSAPFSNRFGARMFMLDSSLHLLAGLSQSDWWTSSDFGVSWTRAAAALPLRSVSATQDDSNSLEFDGVGGYAGTSASNGLWGATVNSQIQSTFTFSFWIFPTALEGPPSMQWRTILAVANGVGVYWSGSAGAFVLAMETSTNAGYPFTVLVTTGVDRLALLNRWSHHVVSYSTTEARWRIDGQTVAVRTPTGAEGSLPTRGSGATTNAFQIGLEATQLGTQPVATVKKQYVDPSQAVQGAESHCCEGVPTTFLTIHLTALTGIPIGAVIESSSLVTINAAMGNTEWTIMTYRPNGAIELRLQGSYTFSLANAQWTGGGPAAAFQTFTIPPEKRWAVENGDLVGWSSTLMTGTVYAHVAWYNGDEGLGTYWQSRSTVLAPTVVQRNVYHYTFQRSYPMHTTFAVPLTSQWAFKGRMRALTLWSSVLSEADASRAATNPDQVASTTRVAFWPMRQTSGPSVDEKVVGRNLVTYAASNLAGATMPRWVQAARGESSSPMARVADSRMGFSVLLFDRAMTLWAGRDSQDSLVFHWPRTHGDSPVTCAGSLISFPGTRASVGSCWGDVASGASCSIACFPGFLLRGAPYRCGSNGVWSGSQSCMTLSDGFRQLQAGSALLPSAPFARRYASLVFFPPSTSRPGLFLLLGGLVGSAAPQPARDALQSVDGITWGPAAASPAWGPRASVSIVDATGVRVWSVGGFDASGALYNDITFYDGSSWSTARLITNLPPMGGHAMVAVAAAASPLLASFGGAIVVGGDMRGGTMGVYLLQLSNTATVNALCQAASPPFSSRVYASFASAPCASCASGVRLFYGFGQSGQVMFSDLFASSDLGVSWTALTTTPISARSGAAMMVLGSSLLVGFGSRLFSDVASGADVLSSPFTYLMAVDRTDEGFNLADGSASLPALDYGNAHTVVNGSVFIVGLAGSFKWSGVTSTSDATLASLSVSAGRLVPPFASNTYSYNVYLSTGSTTTSLKAEPSDALVAEVTVAVNGSSAVSTLASGASMTISSLSFPASLVTVRVVSADSSVSAVYAIYFIQREGSVLGMWQGAMGSSAISTMAAQNAAAGSCTQLPTGSLVGTGCIDVPYGGSCSFSCPTGLQLVGGPLYCLPSGEFVGTQTCTTPLPWTSAAWSSVPRTGAIATYCESTGVLVAGSGSTGGSVSDMKTDMWRSTDDDAMEWSPITPLLSGRLSAGMVCDANGRVHIFAGFNGNIPAAHLWIHSDNAHDADPLAVEWSAGVTLPALSGSAVTANFQFAMVLIPRSGLLDWLAIGGTTAHNHAFDVWRFHHGGDSSSPSLTRVCTDCWGTGINKHGAQAAYIGNTLVLVGGTGDSADHVHHSFDDGITWTAVMGQRASTRPNLYWAFVHSGTRSLSSGACSRFAAA